VWSKIEQKLGFLNLHSEGSKMFRYFFFLSSSDYTILDNDFYLISTKISEGGSRGRGAGFCQGHSHSSYNTNVSAMISNKMQLEPNSWQFIWLNYRQVKQ